MDIQNDAVELFRWLVGTAISILMGGFYYLLKTKADRTEVQDHQHEDERVQQMQNERMDRIQRDVAYLRDRNGGGT